jgi:cytochrome P450
MPMAARPPARELLSTTGRDALPPGPRRPAALQTVSWFRGAQAMMRRCHARYGETFTLRILHEGTWVMLSNPAHIRQVFAGDPQVLHAGAGNRVLLPVLGPHSVLLLDGRAHMQQRRLLLPPFHGERMRGYEETMREIAAAEIAGWPAQVPYRVRPRMQRVQRLRHDLRHLLDLLTDPRMLAVPLLLGPERLARFGPFRRLMQQVDDGIRRLIAETRQNGGEGHASILSLLLEARHEDGAPMSDDEVRDELLTLLVAGHETTANALAWAVERLARHPAKAERLRGELEEGRGEYLEAVIQETLRLRPVISLVARRLAEPVEIGPWRLPPGVTVTPAIYLVHRRPDVYPDPERFEPERFLAQPPGTYTWIPFGGGVRRCLGAAFAQMEMSVVLGELFRRRGVRPSRPEPEPVLRRAITETPRYDAEVVLT